MSHEGHSPIITNLCHLHHALLHLVLFKKSRFLLSILLLLSVNLYLTSIYLYLKKIRHKRRWWVRPINRTRSDLGYFNKQFKEAYETDHEEFFNMTRMTPAQYDYLCNFGRPFLIKKSLRKPISVNERVAVTLLFLAHGDSARSKSWDFRISKSTVYKIIHETSDITALISLHKKCNC